MFQLGVDGRGEPRSKTQEDLVDILLLQRSLVTILQDLPRNRRNSWYASRPRYAEFIGWWGELIIVTV